MNKQISDSSDNYEIIEDDFQKNTKSHPPLLLIEELINAQKHNNSCQQKEDKEETFEEKSKKIIVLGLSGLDNLGNTCFMNAALQCLSASDLLTSYIICTSKKGNSLYKDDLKTCVINRLLKQKKITEEDLAKEELDDDVRQMIRKEFKESLTYSFRKLIFIMWSENCTVRPKSFKINLGQKKPMFKGFQQQDSQECLLEIIDQIHEETKTDVKIKFVKLDEEYKKYIDYYETFYDKYNDEKISKEERIEIFRKHIDMVKDKEKMNTIISSLFFRKKYLKNNHSVINDIFSGIYLTKFNCKECKNTSMKFDHNTILSLAVPRIGWNDKINLEKCLDDYFLNVDELNGDNKYSCDYCDNKTEANKKTEIWNSPRRMIVQLKRFTATGQKNNATIEYPMENLDMTKYFNEYSNKKTVYDLYGVIMHTGGLMGGHYFAFTKNPINDKWYHYDDDDVRHVPDDEIEKDIQNHLAYVLFYKKREF